MLSSPPVLHFPDYSNELIVLVYASEAGVGEFLAQNASEGSDKPVLEIVAYFSKRFTKGQNIALQRLKSVAESSLLCNTGDRIFGVSASNASLTMLLSRI